MTKNETKDSFLRLHDLKSVANILDTTPKKLAFILYNNQMRISHYTEYAIPKKNGGVREISAPSKPLEILQTKLRWILEKIHEDRPSVHGFVKGRSIKTNASLHKNKRHVLNLDLADFFPSINFGRVRGLFMAKPYCLPKEAATILAQICCHKGSLPQGAPTSPIISNMISSKLDRQLQQLAKTNRATYSRYADDLTFSTNLRKFPVDIAHERYGKLTLSAGLTNIIAENGFKINERKIRLQPHIFRQEVTGLITNEYVNVKRSYIRDLRSALHKWEKNGIVEATKEYFEKYVPISKKNQTKNYKKVLRGKIEFLKMIRTSTKAQDNKEKLKIFYKFLDKYHLNSLRDFKKTVLRTEGKTDWLHFERSLLYFKEEENKFLNLDIEFYKSKDHYLYGSSKLLEFCQMMKNNKIFPYVHKVICIFDGDEKNILKSHSGATCKSWNGNVYSIILPDRQGKIATDKCVELLYDEDIITSMVDGKRLYLSTEFNSTTGKHKSENKIYKGNIDYLNGPKKIIDANVFEIDTGKSVALSKNRFAIAIHSIETGFENINYTNFERLFTEIESIVSKD